MCNTFLRFTIKPILKTLVVGLGSPYGNDQLGWILVDELEKKSIPSLTIFKSKGDGSDWFHEISDYEQVVFVDALLSDDPAGSVIEITSDDLLDGSTKLSGSTHSISLSDSIVLAKTLGLLNVPTRILGASIGNDFSNEHNIHQIAESASQKIMRKFFNSKS